MSEITRDYKETVNNRLRQDPSFAAALLDEAVSLFLNGEPVTARLILTDRAKVCTVCCLPAEIRQLTT